LDKSADTGTICVGDINAKGTLKLGNATYIVDQGNFQVGAQGHISCGHCTIVLTSSSTATSPTIGTVTINAGAEVNMHAPTSGNFANILIYQDRRAGSGVNKINGNSNSVMEGALYFPRQEMRLNGTGGMVFTCGQFVSRTVTFEGTGQINNTCTAGYGSREIKGKHVRLIA
jgi:hypothetical protein